MEYIDGIEFEIEFLVFLALYEDKSLTYKEARKLAVKQWKEERAEINNDPPRNF